MSLPRYTEWYSMGHKSGFVSGVSDLNKMCEKYGIGEYATGARSITLEDVDRITGYDKTTYEYPSGDYKIQYGESITYYWDNTSGKEDYPYYITSSGVTGNLTHSHSCFTYYNGKEWVTSTKPTSLTDKQEICTLTETYYGCDIDEETDLQETAPEAYNMLVDSFNDYWLATTSTFCYEDCVIFGFGVFHFGYYAQEFYYSYDEYNGNSYNIRPVVQLSPEYNP